MSFRSCCYRLAERPAVAVLLDQNGLVEDQLSTLDEVATELVDSRVAVLVDRVGAEDRLLVLGLEHLIDDRLTVAALEADFWAEFCHTIGRDALTERQFDPSAVDDVQSALASATRDEWMARFRDRDVCVEPVLGLAELNED